MKASIEIELKPFDVPNYVITVQPPRPKQDGIQELPTFHLSDLDPLTLDRLCRDFRDDVFKKAGKQQPPQEACRCGVTRS